MWNKRGLGVNKGVNGSKKNTWLFNEFYNYIVILRICVIY